MFSSGLERMVRELMIIPGLPVQLPVFTSLYDKYRKNGKITDRDDAILFRLSANQMVTNCITFGGMAALGHLQLQRWLRPRRWRMGQSIGFGLVIGLMFPMFVHVQTMWIIRDNPRLWQAIRQMQKELEEEIKAQMAERERSRNPPANATPQMAERERARTPPAKATPQMERSWSWADDGTPIEKEIDVWGDGESRPASREH